MSSSLPTLDLHGYRKAEAIRRLTTFLEENSSWVCIITGTGSHSSDGPVLRTAVLDLLEKREMDYRRETPGAFVVNASSGHVLFEPPPPEDTKVVVKSAEDINDATFPVNMQKRQRHYVTPTVDPESVPLATIEVGPSVAELAAEERVLAQAREESILAFQQQMRVKAAEEKELSEALRLSLTLKQPAVEEDEDALQKALRLSAEQERIEREEEEKLLKQVLDKSENEKEYIDDELSLILKLSALESQKQEEEEQRMLEEALRRSQEEQHRYW